MSSLEEIKTITQAFVKELDSHKEPLDSIRSINKILKVTIDNPAFGSESSGINQFISETMVPEICQAIARQSVFINQDVAFRLAIPYIQTLQ